MISADADGIIKEVPALQEHRASLTGRAMLCKRTTVFPIECVIRGYLSGSAWKEYAQTGTLAGEKLNPGLVESEKLSPAIFSPATKAETGHDENITVSRMMCAGPGAISPRASMQSRKAFSRSDSNPARGSACGRSTGRNGR